MQESWTAYVVVASVTGHILDRLMSARDKDKSGEQVVRNAGKIAAAFLNQLREDFDKPDLKRFIVSFIVEEEGSYNGMPMEIVPEDNLQEDYRLQPFLAAARWLLRTRDGY